MSEREKLAELERHLCTLDGRGPEAKRAMLREYVAAALREGGEPVAWTTADELQDVREGVYGVMYNTAGEVRDAMWAGEYEPPPVPLYAAPIPTVREIEASVEVDDG